MTASAMTEQASEQNLLFDRYRRPCSEVERDSVHDYDNIELFTNVLSMGLESIDVSFDLLAPKVLIDVQTGEIGLAFNQVEILTKTGRMSEAKFRKVHRKVGHHNWVFVSNTSVSCMVPGYASLELDSENTALIAAVFLAGIVKEDPFIFPECPHCAAEAE